MMVLGIRGMRMRRFRFVLSISLMTASPAPAQDWSDRAWLDDLAQARQAFATKYANIDWLESDRETPLADLFDKAATGLRSARSDADAKAVFDRLIERVGDGHVSIEWPHAAVIPSAFVAAPARQTDVCGDLGFDQKRSTAGTAPYLPGYRPVVASGPFPAGMIAVGTQTVGVIRIGDFEPQGSPSICREALRAVRHAGNTPCDDKCQDAILAWTYTRLTAALEEQVRRLRAVGATVLMVDITDNGGGTEWAEAAARIVSPRPLTSERRGFVRGPHWSEHWKTLSAELREAAKTADKSDRARLSTWAAEAEKARTDADRRCIGNACAVVGRAGYSTGLVGTAPAGEFTGKSWADLIFSIAQFPYHDSVWSGPLAVLVDDQTWSAAEEFAAILQDNDAAVIIGTRTGGAGCGHTDGGTPTILKDSGATLELPDCVRFRADGSNEVAGIIPDVLTGIKASDGSAYKARLIGAHLRQAVSLAID